jgi:V/A-type H+-transporting ATPase subunit E
MGLAAIEKRILDSAQAEAEQILREAREEAQRIEAGARERSQERYNVLAAEAQHKADGLTRRLLTPERLESKKLILAAKQEIMDSVFKGIPAQIREQKEIKVAEVLYG